MGMSIEQRVAMRALQDMMDTHNGSLILSTFFSILNCDMHISHSTYDLGGNVGTPAEHRQRWSTQALGSNTYHGEQGVIQATELVDWGKVATRFEIQSRMWVEVN